MIDYPGRNLLRVQVGRVDDDQVMEFRLTKSALAYTKPEDWLAPSLESMWAEYQSMQRANRASARAAARDAIKRAMAA